jgi:hypothetical protein
LKVGVHALGYVAETTQEAADEFFPGYARAVTDVGKERGWPPVTRAAFDAQRGPHGALLEGLHDVVVRDGRIAAIATPGAAADGVTELDGKGRFQVQVERSPAVVFRLLRNGSESYWVRRVRLGS